MGFYHPTQGASYVAAPPAKFIQGDEISHHQNHLKAAGLGMVGTTANKVPRPGPSYASSYRRHLPYFGNGHLRLVVALAFGPWASD